MNQELKEKLIEQGKKAKDAKSFLATVSSIVKDKALINMAEKLEQNTTIIIEANAIDLKNGESQGLSKALLERLTLNEERIKDMANGIREIAAFPDPIGEIEFASKRPNGLEVGKTRVPIGVIGIIYESRPNVTADAAALCLKAGNAILMRGGEEAINSNRIIAQICAMAAEEMGIPEGAIQLVDSEDKEAAVFMMKMIDYLDLLIPRGGKGLKQAVLENAQVPIIMTGMGNCHVYVDRFADLHKAWEITYNAKVQRPSVCNAAEKLLVDKEIAEAFLPEMLKRLQSAGVVIKACEKTRKLFTEIEVAEESDWDEEYLDLIIAVKIVEGLEEAIQHINRHGTGHSEAIVSQDYSHVRRFIAAVDAAAVYANASTRFTDGNVFGLGAEMGISTQKIHARGPMGLKELTTSKFYIYGDGHIR